MPSILGRLSAKLIQRELMRFCNPQKYPGPGIRARFE